MLAPLLRTSLVVLFISTVCGAISVAAHAEQSKNHQDSPIWLKAGPHLDGNAYRALRGGKALSVVAFELLVTDEKGKRALTVLLGPDFVVETEDQSARIYDIRFRRLLEMELADKAFSNDSLFGKWHLRYAFLANNLGTASMMALFGGAKDKPQLMRFWVEQKNALNSPENTVGQSLHKPKIRVRIQKGYMYIQAEEETVATVTPGTLEFPEPDYVTAFAAWLVWSQRIHPEVAGKIGGSHTIPARIDRVIGDWGQGERKSASLRMQNARLATEKLGILTGRAAKTPTWEPYYPNALAELMVSAARGQAPNGPIDDEDYAGRIEALMAQKKFFDASLLSMHAAQPYDSCVNRSLSPKLCAAVRSAQRKASLSDRNSQILFQAVELNSSSGMHVEGARAFLSLRGQKTARPDILEFMILNALVGGKMYQGRQFDASLNREFKDFMPRIASEFKHDPYDPFRYKVYYNYLHASFAGTENLEAHYYVHMGAYPIVDLARILPQRRVPRILSQVTEQEMKIAKDFPVLFPVYGQRRASR